MDVLKIEEFLSADNCNSGGCGYGDGSGNGYGYGSGYGIKSINGYNVYEVDSIPTILTHIHGNIAKGYRVYFRA